MTLLACLVLCGAFFGCASNMNLSESIIFADRSHDEYDRMHIITGGGVSAEYIPGLDEYGMGHYRADSITSFRYMEFDPGVGGGIGVANKTFAAALSAQLFRFGADVTFVPLRPFYLTANATTSGSYGLYLNARVSGAVSAGPFFRSDEHRPVPKAPFMNPLPDGATPFMTEAVGVRTLIMRSTDTGREQLFTLALGIVPRVRAVMIIFGIHHYGPYRK